VLEFSTKVTIIFHAFNPNLQVPESNRVSSCLVHVSNRQISNVSRGGNGGLSFATIGIIFSNDWWFREEWEGRDDSLDGNGVGHKESENFLAFG
jgi:hypothetical protein